MGINIAVFAMMFPFGPVMGLIHQHAWGSILTAPFDVNTLIRFGATATDKIQAGEWWRLVTGAFVHVTILHIALNMWCLWNLGIFGEPLLGKRGLIAVYLLTGTTGMMFSYAWSIASGQVAYVAGASGAVFGIAGILIVLLSNRKLQVPWEELRSLRRQVIFFADREPGDRHDAEHAGDGLARPTEAGAPGPEHAAADRQHGACGRVSERTGAGTAAVSAHDVGAGELSGTAESDLCVGDAAALPVRLCAGELRARPVVNFSPAAHRKARPFSLALRRSKFCLAD